MGRIWHRRGWIAVLRFRQSQQPGKMRDLVVGAYLRGKPPPPRLDDPRAVDWILASCLPQTLSPCHPSRLGVPFFHGSPPQ